MKRILTSSVLAAAVTLALAAQAGGVRAEMKAGDKGDMPPIVKENMDRAMKNKLEKCFGVAARGKNDCAEGAHSCAGQTTMDRDKASFVLLPKGDCDKLAGGGTHAS